MTFPLSKADQHEIIDLYWGERMDGVNPFGLGATMERQMIAQMWRADKQLIDSHFSFEENSNGKV